MNSSLMLFTLAMALTLSHVWFKAMYWVLLLSVLWGGFLISLIFPINAELTRFDLLIQSAEVLFGYLLLNVFLIVKYVAGPPLWKPIGYSDFREKVRFSPNRKSYVLAVNVLLTLACLCLVAILVNKTF